MNPLNPVTAAEFTVGNLATFKYHGTLRTGKVETVGETFVRLETDEECPKHKTKFKSYSYNLIERV